MILACATASTSVGEPFNVDFGTDAGSPTSDYGAAADQPGTWNTIVSGNRTYLKGLDGITSSTVSMMLTNTVAGGLAWCGDNALLGDYFYTTGGYTLTVSGLNAGTYDVYYYAPSGTNVINSANVTIGNDLSINGTTVDELSGKSLTLEKGISWDVIRVTIGSGENLTMTATKGSLTYIGLSGYQIVAVPEPATCAMFGGFGVLGLAMLRRKIRN